MLLQENIYGRDKEACLTRIPALETLQFTYSCLICHLTYNPSL